MRSAITDIKWIDCNCEGGKEKYKPGIVLDPFIGCGTTALVAAKMERHWIGIELSEKFCEITVKRLKENMGLLLKEKKGGIYE